MVSIYKTKENNKFMKGCLNRGKVNRNIACPTQAANKHLVLEEQEVKDKQ